MKLKHINTILLVDNIEISRKFYSEILGLEVLHDWQTIVIYQEKFAILQESELQPKEETQKFVRPGLQGRGNIVVYFQSDNLEASCKKLKEEGVEIIHGILTLPWERIFRVYDPDRYVIEIGEPH
jgi:catechol 2,3-dioxygenase-like lactoylglutathione lyase family enzyme